MPSLRLQQGLHQVPLSSIFTFQSAQSFPHLNKSDRLLRRAHSNSSLCPTVQANQFGYQAHMEKTGKTPTATLNYSHVTWRSQGQMANLSLSAILTRAGKTPSTHRQQLSASRSCAKDPANDPILAQQDNCDEV